MITVRQVTTEAEAEEVRALLPQFIDWLLVRYADRADTIRGYFQGQDIEGQMRNLLVQFAPPHAACLLARMDGVPVGMVMVKPHQGDTCEMNRMFVADAARGRGVGRMLVAEIVATARHLGYRRMQLAAGIRHQEALALYRAMGFAEDAGIADTGAGDLEVRMSRAL